VLSGYRIMWMMVMFDLPVGTKEERKLANGFRKDLLDLGFEMAQFSVYMRFCSTGARIKALATSVGRMVPQSGKVSVMTFTDNQYARTINYIGSIQAENRAHPQQLELL